MHRRLLRTTIGAVLLSGLVAVAPSAGASSPSTFATVPVHVCSTTEGANSAIPTLPTTERLYIPSARVGRVSLFCDAHGYAAGILAPTKWHCSALDAADGTYWVSVHAAVRNVNTPMLSFQSFGPCSGCVYGEAWPFLNAGARLASGFSGSINPKPVAGERVRTIVRSADSLRGTMAFTIPAHVPVPRPFATRGEIIYSIPGRYAYQLTCAVSALDQALCDYQVSAFVAPTN